MQTPLNLANQVTFVKAVVPWLESQSYVERYAAFGAFSDNAIVAMVDSDGTLNDLGKAYDDAS